MRRRRDPECQRHERWHESTGLAYRREYAASCPCSQRNVFVVASFPRRSPADQSKPPFFSAFDALAIDDGGGGTGFPANRFAAFYIELMMYEIERAIPTPQVEIIIQRRARRQVFRDGPPLTTGGKNIHEAVHNLAHDHRAFVATAPAWRDQRFDQLPFAVGEVAGIAQVAAVILRAIFICPHWRPPRIRTPLFDHKRFIGFNFSPDRHLGPNLHRMRALLPVQGSL